eukprot:2501634-Rhodomonas_salina.1
MNGSLHPPSLTSRLMNHNFTKPTRTSIAALRKQAVLEWAKAKDNVQISTGREIAGNPSDDTFKESDVAPFAKQGEPQRHRLD